MTVSRTPARQPGRRRKGLCPVCRAERALRHGDGKVMPHGKTAGQPDGCAGSGEPPLPLVRPPGLSRRGRPAAVLRRDGERG